MRIYTRAGDLAFKLFTFPDGQPHFILETYELDFTTVTIEAAIRTPQELMEVLMASDVLRQHGYEQVNLDIRYLLGARMDRAIDTMQPFTLQLVARLLNGAGFTKVRILDAHSEVATRLIRNSSNVLPFKIVAQIITTLGNVVAIAPDKGAIPRVAKVIQNSINRVDCSKERDSRTGTLRNFSIDGPEWVRDRECLIIDDICDGGGTFVGLAKKLREAGAKKIYLYVTHGIFSKGLPLEGIDKVFTTDSYGWTGEESSHSVIIPISMKDI